MDNHIPVMNEHNMKEPPIGKFQLSTDISDIAKHVHDNINLYSFEPGFIQHEDGRVELVELSAVRKSEKQDNNDK